MSCNCKKPKTTPPPPPNNVVIRETKGIDNGIIDTVKSIMGK